MYKLFFSVLFLLSLQSCASSPDRMKTLQVSPTMFKDYTCSQLETEMRRSANNVSILYAGLEKKYNNDTTQTALGVLIFPPLLLMLEGGDGNDAIVYAAIKGELAAMRTVSREKGCIINAAQTFIAKPKKKKRQLTSSASW